jgi:hypothetical protein
MEDAEPEVYVRGDGEPRIGSKVASNLEEALEYFDV